MFRWRAVPRFELGHVYDEGSSPAEHHPEKWPKLETHRYGQVLDERGRARCTVAVHSTRRSRDGWTYNVVEMLQRPVWVAYFHHQNGQRVKHAGTEGAELVEDCFDIHALL